MTRVGHATLRIGVLTVWAVCPCLHAAVLDIDDTSPRTPKALETPIRFDQPLDESEPMAIVDAMTAVRANPDSVTAWIRLGDALFLSEQTARAAAAFYEACKRDPTHAKALENLGVSILQLGDYPNAVALFERLSSREPEDLSVKMNLGAAYHGVRDYANANQVYEAVLKVDPDNDKAAYNLGVVEGDRGNHAGAVAWYRKAHALNSTSPIPLFAAARAYARLGDSTSMYEMLEQAIIMVPEDQVGIFLGHPIFAPYSDQQEFRALLAPNSAK